MASPPKPWEKADNAQPSVAPTHPTSDDLPARPASLTGQTNPSTMGFGGGMSGMSGMNGMGMGMNSYSSPYSSYNSYSSPYSSMSSPYSRYGGYGSGYGVGSGYGGYGGYGMGGMSTGMGGVFGQGDLARNMEASTQQAFSVLESIVMAVQGLAGMLESTLTATHTSFMAMVSVAEQFGNLRSTLGGVVGVFGLLQGLRDLAYRVIGWTVPPPQLTADEFKDFQADKALQPKPVEPASGGSKKPFILFLLFALGFPWLFSRLIRILADRQMKREQEMMESRMVGPMQATFAKVLRPFPKEQPTDLALQPGEVVAITSKLDPQTGTVGDWWFGRKKNGDTGWFPGVVVSELPANFASVSATTVSTSEPLPKLNEF